MALPDGLGPAHAREPGRWSRLAQPLPLLLLAAILVAALLGPFGGRANSWIAAESPAAALRVNVPTVIRNGMVFEMHVLVTPRRPIGDLRLAIPPSLWRDLTVNVMTPTASEEEYKDGLFQFSYGRAQEGEPVEIQIDGQVNSSLVGTNAGSIAVYDGEARLVAVPVEIRVRP